MCPVKKASYLWGVWGCSVLQFEHSLGSRFSRVLNSLKKHSGKKKRIWIKHSNPHIFNLLILHQYKWKCLSQLSWLMYSFIFKMVCDFWHCGTSVLLCVGRWKRNLTTFTEFYVLTFDETFFFHPALWMRGQTRNIDWFSVVHSPTT